MPKRHSNNVELAWPSGDQPDELHFHYRAAPPIEQAILDSLRANFEPAHIGPVRLDALQPSDGPAGRYQMSTSNGRWFVRVSRRWGNPVMEKSLLNYLDSRSVAVNPLLVAGTKMVWEDQVFRIDVRPFIQGRHFNGSLEDLSRLASALAECHRALKTFPETAKVQSIAAARYERLEEVRQMIAQAVLGGSFDDVFIERADWAAQHRDWLAMLVDLFTPRLDLASDAQCLHGQIHPANVVYQMADGTPILVDWEEAVQSFASPAYDLAYFFQRFCLRDNPSPHVLQQRLAAVTSGYGQALPRLATMIRQTCWLSMAVIVDLRLSHNLVTSLTEYNKFVMLEKQARALGDTL